VAARRGGVGVAVWRTCEGRARGEPTGSPATSLCVRGRERDRDVVNVIDSQHRG
jgi:hypothetical protein